MKAMKVAVDAMGGDHAPEAIVEGALLAAKKLDLDEVILVGDEASIEREWAKHHLLKGVPASIVHAAHAVQMHESPARVLRSRQDSSISVAIDLMKDERCDAVVTAGNSGAAMAISMSKLKKLEGVERPALASIHPTLNGASILIDAGGNVDCKPIHLVQFAIMGEIYARFILGKDRPQVGLLSNGTEDSKGNELTKRVHAILRKSGLNYIGYVEGTDISSGTVDVVVCDGFVGNVALKSSEGIADSFIAMLRAATRKSLWARIGYFFMRQAQESIKRRIDYSEYGGVPLLGINGTCFICHGHSSAKAIKSAIRAASKYVQSDINRLLSETLCQSQDLKRFGGETASRIWTQLKEKVMY
jgi:glycerol-3-phosphate acyltransferase PlsX